MDKTNILFEHNKVIKARYAFAIINFLMILIGTAVTLYFVSVKGVSQSVKIHLIALLVINVLQLAVCVTDWIAKRFVGTYIGFLIYISWVLGFLWVATTVGELYTGFIDSGVFRLDLVIIVAIQALTALFAYIFWPLLDRQAIDAMTSEHVRDSEKNRIKKSNRYVRTYILLAVFICLFQAGTLLAYKVPPTVYDIFDENRALVYKENEDGTGYVVTGIYMGTSETVVIPATYNNLPVVGIQSGALTEEFFWGASNVTSITFGSYETDENGEKRLVSNLQFIGEGAIQNNNITDIELPSSIQRIGRGAIESDSLQNVVYKSAAPLRMDVFNCDKLDKVVLSGAEVGGIESLDGMSQNVKIQVAKDDYNRIRQKNGKYALNILPELEDDEICVDFYTDCDTYIPSIIGNGSIRVNVSDLVTESGYDGLVKDTLAFIANPNEVGNDGAKKDSAFRGWYKDAEYTQLVQAENGNYFTFKESTVLYAKWIDEYKGLFDWNTFAPENVQEKFYTGTSSYNPAKKTGTVYWTDEDSIIFPQVSDRDGYFRVDWMNEGNVYTDSEGLSRNMSFKAKWILKTPIISLGKELTNDGPLSTRDAENEIYEYTYDETYTFNVKANVTHEITDKFTYFWEKLDDNGYSKAGSLISMGKVADSGTYRVTVVATAPEQEGGETSTASREITITINRKDLSIGDVALYNYENTYNGSMQSTDYVGTLPAGIGETWEYIDGVNVNDSGFTHTGDYKVRVTFSKNDPDAAANYNTLTKQAAFVIKPCALTFNSWVRSDTKDVSDITYSGDVYGYEMKFDGVIGEDLLNLKPQYSGNGKKYAGDYVTTLTAINNTDYTIDGIDESVRSHVWTIARREITVGQWKFDSVGSKTAALYDGSYHTVNATTINVVSGDKVNFLYDVTPTYSVSAKNAGDYTAKIIGVDNENYFYDGTPSNSKSEFAWSITKRPLAINYTNNQYVYNGNEQFVTATINNFVPGELTTETVSKGSFIYEGTSAELNIYGNVFGDNYVIRFGGTNAKDGYVAAISALANTALTSNYSLTAKSVDFDIAKKQISLRITDSVGEYNGDNQEFTVYIDGIVNSDISGITADFCEFDTTGDFISVAIEKKLGGAVVSCYVKNAGVYTIKLQELNDGSGNYIIGSTETLSIDISKKSLDVVSWNVYESNETEEIFGNFLSGNTSNQVTYNYYGYNVSPVIAGVAANDHVELNLSGDYDNRQNAGNYTAIASLDGEFYKNYVMNDATLNWTIKKFKVSLGWKFADTGDNAIGGFEIYDGTQKSVVPVVTELPGSLDVSALSINYSANTTLSATNANTGAYNKVQTTSLGNSNFELEKNYDFTWYVKQREITVSWDALDTLTYDGTYQGPTFHIFNLVEADKENTKFKVRESYTAASKNIPWSANNSYVVSGNTNGLTIDAGNYSVSVDCVMKGNAVDNNYTVQYETGYKNYTIGRKTLTLDADWTVTNNDISKPFISTDNFVYNKKPYIFTKGFYGAVTRTGSSEVDALTLVYSSCSATNANLYTGYISSISGTYAKNYQLPESGTTVSWTIRPKSVNAVWSSSSSFVFSNSSYTYSASYNTGAANDTDGLVYTGDSFSFTYANNVKTNAADYMATITAISNSNYFIAQNTSTHAWTITPKPVSLSWSQSSFIYNGSVQYPTASYTYNGATVTATSYSGNSNTNKGNYTVTATGLSNSNFTLKDGTNVAHDYEIQPLAVQLSWKESGYVFSSNGTPFNYDGTTHTITAEVTNKQRPDDVINLTYKDNTAKNAGSSYKAAVESVDNPNYTVDPYNNYINFKVGAKQLSVTWGTSSFTYDGTEKTVTAEVYGGCGSDDLQINYSNNKRTNYGSQTAQISTSNTNYTIQLNTTCTLTVNKKSLTISWSTSSFTYDGTEKSVTADFGGVCGSDDLQISYSNNRRTNNGSQTATVSISNTNYSLPSNYSCKLEIEKKEVTLIWPTVKTFVYDHSAKSVVASAGNTVSGDTVTVSCSNSSNTNVGNYTATATGLSNSNYKLPSSNLTCNYSITQREVTLSWNANVFEYNRTSQQVTVNIGNVVDGDVVSAIFSDSSANVNAGVYTANVIRLNNSNYKLPTSNLSCDYSIMPKEVSLLWSGTTFTYDASSHCATATIGGVLSGDSVEVVYGANSVKTVAGNHTATVTGLSGAGSNNYKLPTDGLTCLYTIQQKEVSLNWTTNTTFTYDKQYHPVRATLGNVINGDSVVLTYSDYSQINAGNYTSVITGLSGGSASNYKLPSNGTSKDYTIKPIVLELTWGIKLFTYNGTNQKPSLTFNNILSGDSVAATVVVKQNGSELSDYSGAGDYVAYVVDISNGNYTLPTTGTSCAFTISKIVLEYEWNANAFTYNGENQHPQITFTNLVFGDTVESSVIVKQNGIVVTEYSEVGSYETELNGITSENYTLIGSSSSRTAGFVINAKQVTYSVSYDKGNDLLMVELNGVLAKDAGKAEADYEILIEDLVVEKIDPEVPGYYEVSVKGVTGAAGNNYWLNQGVEIIMVE